MTGKAMWKRGSYLSGGDKEVVMSQIRLVRDAPSESQYDEREKKLLEITKDLLVRPGQALNLIPYSEYYERNWRNCNFRWVLAFRKNLPTKGCNDTQVCSGNANYWFQYHTVCTIVSNRSFEWIVLLILP